MTFGARKDCSGHVQASHTSRRHSEIGDIKCGGGCLTSPGQREVRRTGQTGTDGLADWQTAKGQQLDVLSFTSGPSRTAELPRRLAPWSYMTLWQFQFWTTRAKMKFR